MSPLYDYECLSCKGQFESVNTIANREQETCPKCQSPTKLLITNNKKDWFRPHLNEHLDHEPIYVESKEHYKKLCDERGLTARCLL